jgi:hypothetical protein
VTVVPVTVAALGLAPVGTLDEGLLSWLKAARPEPGQGNNMPLQAMT